MAKMSEETRAQIRQALRHPVVWWKGADVPEENFRPWESGIQFLAEGLKGFMSGYTDIKDLYYIGTGDKKIKPNHKSFADIVNITWDALTNPLAGIYMDKKNFGETIHRWVMRFNATLSPLFILIQCFKFGEMEPMQRIIFWGALRLFSDFMSTSNAISETKIWAGITPYSERRGALQLWKTLGGHLAGAASGIPYILMGLKDVLHITDYQIMIYGALIFAPLTIFARWLPSFAKQRVDFTVKVEGEDAQEAYEKLGFRESFAVVKHNKWFMMWLVVNFIRLVIPKTDERFFFRFLLPHKTNLLDNMTFRGEPLGGDLLYVIRGAVTGLPGLLLSPLANRAVKWFGGEVGLVKGHVISIMLMRASVYLIGYDRWWKLLYMFFMEMVKAVFDMWAPVAHRGMEFMMLDYVEWKTGYRSEGMTKSVDGILNKLIKDNIGNVFSNAVKEWTGYKSWETPANEQPERFYNTMWPLMHVGVFIGEVIVMTALMLFKHPQDPKQVEADLIERRALAKQLKEEAESII